MSTNAKTRYNISKVFGPAVPDKGSKDSDPSADNMAGIAINGKTAYCAKRSQTSSNIFVIENILPNLPNYYEVVSYEKGYESFWLMPKPGG